MRNLIQNGLLLGILVAPAVAQSPCATQGITCQQISTTTFKKVFEQVHGSANGTNRLFELSEVPAPQFPLHLFSNGIELVPSSDYTLQGRVVILSGRTVESTGQVVQAAYEVEVVGLDEAIGSARSESVKGARLVLAKYLQRSLSVELASVASELPQAVGTTDDETSPLQQGEEVSTLDTRRVHTRPVGRATSISGGESLRMLSIAMSRSNDHARKSKHDTSESTYPSQADGIEGIGDQLTSSPFDIIANGLSNASSAGIVGERRSSERSTSARRGHVPSEPEALRLLQRSISQHQ